MDDDIMDALTVDIDRHALVRRGRMLSWITVGYNVLEALGSLVAAILAGSISLLGFGIDSLIEVASGGASLFRLRADADASRREFAERRALRVIGLAFLALAIYIALDAIHALATREKPDESLLGIFIAIGSLIFMPLLARAKRRVASALSSRALGADATQTDICAYLSALLLGGLLLNALLGWWWADPVAALVMAPIIGREGWQNLRGIDHCADCASM